MTSEILSEIQARAFVSPSSAMDVSENYYSRNTNLMMSPMMPVRKQSHGIVDEAMPLPFDASLASMDTTLGPPVKPMRVQSKRDSESIAEQDLKVVMEGHPFDVSALSSGGDSTPPTMPIRMESEQPESTS